LEARITLSYKNVRDAEAVAEAVSPDNVKAPSGLVIETRREGSKVLTLVKCEKGLSTFIATIDDLLSCVSVAERVFSIAKER
jgi:tRNA threonylcarbamoyladenosine modification (KEOPS) complex  Pcc1 subunit